MPVSPEVWYNSIPPFSKVLLTTILFTTLAVSFEVLSLRTIGFDAVKATRGLQVWRIVTDFLFVGGFSFGWLFEMYILSDFSAKLENNELFRHNPGDYLQFLLFQMLSICFVSTLLDWPRGSPFNGRALVFSIVYYWSRREPYGQVIYWGFLIAAHQLPWAMLVLEFLMGGSLKGSLIGAFTGHLFYFFREVLPAEKNIDLLSKPLWFLDAGAFRFRLWMAGQSSSNIRTVNSPARDRPTRPQEAQSRLFSGSARRLDET